MFIELLPLAIGSSIYPTLLTMVLLIITRPNPRPMLFAFAAGGFITSITAGCIIVFALGGTVDQNDHTIGPAVNFAMAGVLLLLLWILITDRDRALRERRQRKKEEKAAAEPEDDGRDPWTRRLMARDSLWLAFLVGLVLNVPGALYLVALKDIAAADLSTARAVLNIVLYNVIMFVMLEVPLLGFVFSPERTKLEIERFNSWLAAHTRQIAMWLCGGIAVYLIARGIADLS